MTQLDQTVKGFLQSLSSKAATPGGGSASALVGAVGAALCGMIGRLNDKKDGAPGPLHDTLGEADRLLARLGELIDEDVLAFEALAASWKLSDDSPENAAAKESAAIAATQSPLEIMEQAVAVMRLAVSGLEKSKKNCLSDAGVAGLMAHAALEGARLNVAINLPGIKDAVARYSLRTRSGALRDEAAALRKRIDALIDASYG
ncbi:MAG: cyclodeaminase/cyclohydrolase family protein [Planctomycetia bacterium]|nr:cyclodeaminase/cyclohydrolase family protein [Planctomycetia bacterium]MCC7315935.1 cyclodeaminase/cyclohydrolase family protein [Planctomycetota bacterium]